LGHITYFTFAVVSPMQAAQTPEPVIAQTPAPTPAAPPAPAVVGAQGGGGGQGGGLLGEKIVRINAGATPNQIYEALKNQRSELRNQLERLEEQRDDLARQLREPGVVDADKKGIEQRISFADQRIAETEKALADADKSVANAAAQPGAILPPRPEPRDPGPPEEFWVLTGIALFVIGLPLTIAYARRIWRRSAGVVTGIPAEIWERFNKIDHAVDAIAIEVERVGEGQRYLTRMHAEQRAVGAGPAQRVDVAEREQEQVRK
jgi:hypothetical protein